ncbi:MAG: hypothetical protein ABI675_31115 [Chitinophagaceae bacterium]
MELTTAILNDIVSVDHCWDDGNNTEYIINTSLAISHQQIIQLTDIFKLHYGLIKKATNWGTFRTFDVVIENSKFKVPAGLDDAFKKFVGSINETHAPTETNFWYYLDPKFKCV